MNKRQAKKKRKYQKLIEEYLKASEKLQKAMLQKDRIRDVKQMLLFLMNGLGCLQRKSKKG